MMSGQPPYLQARFSALVVANTRRTAALCAAPGALALFALELLRDQAESALRLVKAYDESSLGLAEVGGWSGWSRCGWSSCCFHGRCGGPSGGHVALMLLVSVAQHSHSVNRRAALLLA
jgi:hypothetical protein